MGETEDVLRSWERKVLSALMALLIAVFGIWAGVVYRTGQGVLAEVSALRREMSANLIVTERRLTILEQRQSYVIEALKSRHNGAAVPTDEDSP